MRITSPIRSALRSRVRFPAFFVLIVLCAGVLLAGRTESAPRAPSVQTTVYLPIISLLRLDSIAFLSNRDGNTELYRMRADGSEQTRLTNTSADEGDFAWSPDGAHIVFISQRDGNAEIYVMNADGSNQLRLTTTPAFEDLPKWSPDGSKIMFVSARDGQEAIYVMNADGSNQSRLTDTPIALSRPDWSPDGSKIVFVSTRDTTDEIYVMNRDGSVQTRLTNTTLTKSWPVWSPTGTKIAFVADLFSGTTITSELDIMNTDGSGLQPLFIDSVSFPDSLSWSPDGSKIVFVAAASDATRKVSVVNADGTGRTSFMETNTRRFEFYPRWSPDGTQIAFGAGEIYVMQADGSNRTRLTDSGVGESGFPKWSPTK